MKNKKAQSELLILLIIGVAVWFMFFRGGTLGEKGTWTFDSKYAYYDSSDNKCYKEVTTCYGNNIKNGQLCGDEACDKITCINNIILTNVLIDDTPTISQMGEDRKMINCAQYYLEVDQQKCMEIGGSWIPNKIGYDRYNCY